VTAGQLPPGYDFSLVTTNVGQVSLDVMASGAIPISLPVVNSGWMEFSFPTENGSIYQVEYKNLLNIVDWNPLKRVAGTGDVLKIQDNDLSLPQRFYRVRIEPLDP
jgi:hypothetical protein